MMKTISEQEKHLEQSFGGANFLFHVRLTQELLTV